MRRIRISFIQIKQRKNLRLFLTARKEVLEGKNLDHKILYDSAANNISLNIMLFHNCKMYTLKIFLIKNLEYNCIRKKV